MHAHGPENRSWYTGAVATFPKTCIIEWFSNMLVVSRQLGFAFPQTKSVCQRVGRGWGKEKEWKKESKRHLKLNLKMCFFWTPVCAAINQGRHFHTQHFSWFRSEFPPFLSLHLGSGYVLPHWLQTTGDGASSPREKPNAEPPPTPSGRGPVVLGRLLDSGADP